MRRRDRCRVYRRQQEATTKPFKLRKLVSHARFGRLFGIQHSEISGRMYVIYASNSAKSILIFYPVDKIYTQNLCLSQFLDDSVGIFLRRSFTSQITRNGLPLSDGL